MRLQKHRCYTLAWHICVLLVFAFSGSRYAIANAEYDSIPVPITWTGADTAFSDDSVLVDVNMLRTVTYPYTGPSWLYYPSAESNLPYHRKVFYGFGHGAVNLVLGALRGRDTVVCGNYFLPYRRLQAVGPIRTLSNIRWRKDYDPQARHHLEVLTTWREDYRWDNLDEPSTDTLAPLGIEVHQSIYAWNHSALKRAIIVDNWILNTSSDIWREPTVGVHTRFSALNLYLEALANDDTLSTALRGTFCGLIPVVPGSSPLLTDSVNIAWTASIHGDPYWTNGRYGPRNPTAVVGVRVLVSPPSTKSSFNWWSWYPNTGPQKHESRATEQFRGFPFSDRAFYKRMTNGEIDYDQWYSALDMTSEGWASMGSRAATRDLADGSHTEMMLSAGPFVDPMLPGDSVRFTYAIVIGDDFHTDPDHFARTFDYTNPAPYINGLNFSNLISAAQWAGWFFDNPGVDTDGDGYAGEFHLVDCSGGCDTVYYSGDGVPDFKGPQPPPPPDDITFETYPTRIIARWTGKATEFARDRHFRRPDWEGYKVYLAADDTAKGWSLVGSWDRADYVRYSYHEVKQSWIRNSQPHTVDEWRQILSDPEFDPLRHPLPSLTTGYHDIATDTVRTASGAIVDIVTHERWSYFAAEAGNHQNAYVDNGRTLANPIQRVATVDTVIDGRVRQYGVYEYSIDDLSQSKVHWLTVTAFDYGDYRNFIEPEESAPGAQAVRFVPVNSADVVVDSNLRVNVHPNPYKSEFYDMHGHLATYHSQGYEYAPSGTFDERDRRVWFTNLPDTAVIEIYSLDGDLIRIIRHPDDFLTKYESVVGWDLISRNTQAVTSGIYIWKVTSRLGEQVGKLVIIK